MQQCHSPLGWDWCGTDLLIRAVSSWNHKGSLACDNCFYALLYPPRNKPCARCLPFDQYGDHILRCGQSPLHVCCHDALCNTMYHAFSLIMFDKRVHLGKKQRGPRGYSTHISMFLCVTQQLGNLNYTCVNIGAATVVGEILNMFCFFKYVCTCTYIGT